MLERAKTGKGAVGWVLAPSVWLAPASRNEGGHWGLHSKHSLAELTTTQPPIAPYLALPALRSLRPPLPLSPVPSRHTQSFLPSQPRRPGSALTTLRLYTCRRHYGFRRLRLDMPEGAHTALFARRAAVCTDVERHRHPGDVLCALD